MMSKFYKKLGTYMLVICLSFFGVIRLDSFAIKTDQAEILKLKESLSEKIANDPLSNCRENLFERYDLELVEFLEFIDLNFQNKSANSELVNIAISRYAEYKSNLTLIFASTVPGARLGQLNADELDAYFDCSKIKDSYVEIAKKQMIEHIKNTTSQKRATILVEKYQGLNDRLRDLNFSIARMYGFFVTFKDKLPFYTEVCQQK